MDFDGAVDSIETIYLVFKQLIGRVVSELTRRGCGARRIEIEFFRAYAQTIAHAIALSRPSRDPVNLFNLIRCATDSGTPALTIARTPDRLRSCSSVPVYPALRQADRHALLNSCWRCPRRGPFSVWTNTSVKIRPVSRPNASTRPRCSASSVVVAGER